ncbi:unnamed protein product, partial [Closterium sp. NIES-53]
KRRVSFLGGSGVERPSQLSLGEDAAAGPADFRVDPKGNVEEFFQVNLVEREGHRQETMSGGNLWEGWGAGEAFSTGGAAEPSLKRSPETISNAAVCPAGHRNYLVAARDDMDESCQLALVQGLEKREELRHGSSGREVKGERVVGESEGEEVRVVRAGRSGLAGLEGPVEADVGIGEKESGSRVVSVDMLRGTVQRHTDSRLAEASRGVPSGSAAGSDSAAATAGGGMIAVGGGRGITAGLSNCMAGRGSDSAEENGAVIDFTDRRRVAEASAGGALQWEEASQSMLGPVATQQGKSFSRVKPATGTSSDARLLKQRRAGNGEAEGAAEVLQQEPLG